MSLEQLTNPEIGALIVTIVVIVVNLLLFSGFGLEVGALGTAVTIR